ncbi:hypothetical protein PtrM4_070420 [Pyrenophora tritici-repentis]|uniref:Uncharacterized protein n=1 Tax=Pyrenophora tritici-repentis TaxID=45151 RepID=A0A834S4F1_9PLEO|nr:hypothetical protein PtrM4_070420 [Pyrenophora tritici-repentis]
MPPRRAPQVSSNEANIKLAISSIKAGQIQSKSSAASIYSVPPFRSLGLVPLQLEAVLLKLDVQLRTPTPLAALLKAP